MSDCKATLSWQRKTSDWSYDTYDRTHAVALGSGSRLTMTAAPEFRGDPS